MMISSSQMDMRRTSASLVWMTLLYRMRRRYAIADSNAVCQSSIRPHRLLHLSDVKDLFREVQISLNVPFPLGVSIDIHMIYSRYLP